MLARVVELGHWWRRIGSGPRCADAARRGLKGESGSVVEHLISRVPTLKQRLSARKRSPMKLGANSPPRGTPLRASKWLTYSAIGRSVAVWLPWVLKV